MPLRKSRTDQPISVLGLMSGTSVDSVDYAVCQVSLARVELKRYWQVPFPKPLRQRLLAAASNEASCYEVGQLHHDLGRFYAQHARVEPGEIDLCGVHGQTVYHFPHSQRPATFQLGEAAWLAEKLQVPVISNFRSADLAAGGQGAPLATLFHRVIFARKGEHVCVNNLGGISNVTSLHWPDGDAPNILSFDTGPANMLIDLAMHYLTEGKHNVDRNGSWARQGRWSDRWLRRLMRHAFLRKAPPKSTGREAFGESFFKPLIVEMRAERLSRFDILATWTEFTARSVWLNYRLHLPAVPNRLILAGGGASNLFLTERIRVLGRELNPKMEIMTSEEAGWPNQAIEPAAFALLAYYRFRRVPANFPQTTGAHRAVLLGQITEV
ncbi:MAG: anhydro-N-acetylmuramic acid kinase [Verrucomicrobiota bacterium]